MLAYMESKRYNKPTTATTTRRMALWQIQNIWSDLHTTLQSGMNGDGGILTYALI
jgi:hypothetical protein